MDVKEAGTSLDSLISAFNARIAELQQLVIARNMYPASSVSDLSAVDSALSGMELQLQKIRTRLREETEAIPKAKKLIEASLKQQKKLQTLAANMPLNLSGRMTYTTQDTIKCVQPEPCKDDLSFESLKVEEPAPREKKGRASPPLWYLSADDLNSCPA
nr:spindle and kinetochore-associated protein 1 homolog [Ipomoea batatas]